MPSRPSSSESIAYLQHTIGVDFSTDIAPNPLIDCSSPELVPLAEAEEVDDLIRQANEEPMENIASPTPTTQAETITFPVPSDHASSSEETPTIEPDPILPRPPLTHEDAIIHPGYPWIRARTFIGGDVQIPRPTGGLNDSARFLNPTTIYTTGEPVLYGTLSAGTPVYADELMAELRPELSDEEDRAIGGYPFGEQTALNIQVNQALLDMGDHGVLANVH